MADPPWVIVAAADVGEGGGLALVDDHARLRLPHWRAHRVVAYVCLFNPTPVASVAKIEKLSQRTQRISPLSLRLGALARAKIVKY